jgi:hypothetical protein
MYLKVEPGLKKQAVVYNELFYNYFLKSENPMSYYKKISRIYYYVEYKT